MNSSIKNAIIACVVLIGFLFAGSLIVKKDNKFPATYFQEVKHDGYQPSPAVWKVDISPKLASEKAKEIPGHIFLKVLGFILIGGVVVLIILGATDRIGLFEKSPGGTAILFVLLAGYLFCQYGATSPIEANNYVNLSPSEFTRITNVSDSTAKYVTDNSAKDLEKLFDKPMIK